MLSGTGYELICFFPFPAPKGPSNIRNWTDRRSEMKAISHVGSCVISRTIAAALKLTKAVYRRACVAGLSSFHRSYPPVYDSRTGFVDYKKEKNNFKLEAPEYFNFANVLDEWAQKEKVRD